MLSEEDLKKLGKGIPRYKDSFPPKTKGLFDDRVVGLIGEANREIGNLNSYSRIIPNPNLLIWPLLLKEALASSKIEGTQASVKDILRKEANLKTTARLMDIQEVINYRQAMTLGVRLLSELPISGRLIKRVHEKLMQGVVRGAQKRIGEYRKGQNAIGREGDPSKVKFLPPPAIEVPNLMGKLENYINNDQLVYDKLVRCALIHLEFEAIHPFADGNGRVGRLLITLHLIKEGVLKYPLIYPSGFFLHHKEDYEALLMRVTTHDDWKGWLEFFLSSIVSQAKQSQKLIERIDGLYQRTQEKTRLNIQSAHGAKLVDLIFKTPIVKAPEVAEKLNVKHRTAISLLRRFSDLGILTYDTKAKKNIPFSNSSLISLLESV